MLIDAAAQVLAAIQSLTPPSATGCANTDVGNLMVYQRALAEREAGRAAPDLGSLASKFLA